MNSGKDGSLLKGVWNLSLPVASVKAWYWDNGLRHTDMWSLLPNTILAVCVTHPNGFKTWMSHVDVYPNPENPEDTRDGYQIGSVNCKEWKELWKEIRS